MSEEHSISDRDAFGHWLSGFVDGEGHFRLGSYPYRHGAVNSWFHASVEFQIRLRADDVAILRQIRAFLECGVVKGPYAGTRNPAYLYAVNRLVHLAKIVIPNFISYPLRAKKARDFEIWKQGALLAFEIKKKRRIRLAGQRGGVFPVWSEKARKQFLELSSLLRQQRQFDCQALDIPERPPEPPERSLF